MSDRLVLGIDPSLTNSGVAAVALDDSSARWTTWQSGSRPADFDRSIASRRRRVRKVLAGILGPIPERFTLAVIEAPSYGSQHGAIHEREWLRGLLIDQLCARGPVVEVAPAKRALLATGNGRADKGMVLASIRDAYPQVHVPTHDVADAVALAAAGAHHLGFPAPYGPKQAKAHAMVAWPIPAPLRG